MLIMKWIRRFLETENETPVGLKVIVMAVPRVVLHETKGNKCNKQMDNLSLRRMMGLLPNLSRWSGK